MDTEVRCAKDKNPNLPGEKACDWNMVSDNWPATKASRCVLYAKGPMVELDVDQENGPADFTDDEVAIKAIMDHSGRGRHGRTDGV
jgi:hypothetical protein